MSQQQANKRVRSSSPEKEGPARPVPEQVEVETRTAVQPETTIKTLRRARHPESCIDLLLDRTPAAKAAVNFLEWNHLALLRGQPGCGKTWLIPAVIKEAELRNDLWSEVVLVHPIDFLQYMESCTKSDRPRPLVIVDDAHLAWSGNCDLFIKDMPYADFLFVTTASSAALVFRNVAPLNLRDYQLWLSAASKDPATVKKWIELLISRSTTQRTENAKARLIEHTFNICGGHVGRVVAFLDAALERDCICVPPDARERFAGRAGVTAFEHPLAKQIFSQGVAMVDLHALRYSTDPKDSRLLERFHNGYFAPVESWKVESAIAEIRDDEQWSLGSAAQRDFITRKLRERTVAVDPLYIHSGIPLAIHIVTRTLPHWRTDLLFIFDEKIEKAPFLVSHVHQAFIDAFARLCCSCPSIEPRLVFGQPAENDDHPPSLDFVVHVDSTGQRLGIQFVINDSFAARRDRFAPGGDYAPLKLDSHLTVYFEADSTLTEAALDFVDKTPNTCAVFPSPVRGWDLFHVAYHLSGKRQEVLVPRVGGTSDLVLGILPWWHA